MIGFLDARWGGAACLLEGVFHDVDQLLQLDQQLDERTITARRTGRALGGGDISLTGQRLRAPGRLQQSRQISIGGARSKPIDEVRDGKTRLGSVLPQPEASTLPAEADGGKG